ncbi:YaaA family protein [Cellulomonas sp. KRMCY2]|uniref:YaaA family protein n=1 Tax=Cellulomonas sp. KRMCY2 TaxID=1304865 RepID=UPI00045E96D2|nr:peroxide stress protein YaaA [Cellulomonas sp. KRMCY2]
MLVLLPPSEGKTAPTTGAPVDLTALSSPLLTTHRRRVLGALVRVSASPAAMSVLRVGPSLAGEVARNVGLRTAPTAPARAVYTGVLYGAARLDDLPDDAARERSDRCVRTISALWGVVGPADLIPAYRLSTGTDLPGVGPLAASWRRPLGRALDAHAARRLVVDCRSATYAAAWSVPATAAGHVTVAVLREADGRRTIVSHSAKHTRGLFTRHLVTRAGSEPRTPTDLLDVAGELVGTTLVDVALQDRGARGHVLVLVVRAPG